MANSTLDHKALNLTRRDFLKLCGSSSIVAILAACGVAPTPIATPTFALAPSPSNTPSVTPSLTPTPSATPTAIVRITSGDWASFVQGDVGYSDKNKGKVNPRKIFPYVGSINQANQSTLDLAFGAMQLAVNTGRVIIADDHMLEKAKVAQDLESQKGFREQLETIRARMASAHKDELDFRNFTVVVEKTTAGYKATQTIYRKVEEWGRVRVSDKKGNLVHDTTYPKKEEIVWYRIMGDTILELMIEEPVLQPLLELKGNTLYQDRKPVLLEGTMVVHFEYKRTAPREFLDRYIGDMIAAMSIGRRLNYVIFQLNAANFGDQGYIDDLGEAIKWSHRQGLRICLDLKSDGFSNPSDKWSEIPKFSIDDRLPQAWSELVDYPGMAAAIRNCVDFVGILNEWNPNNTGTVDQATFLTAIGVYNKAADIIREKIKSENLKYAYGGPANCGNAQPFLLLQVNALPPNTVINIHGYKKNWDYFKTPATIDRLKTMGYCCLVNEIGWTNSLDYPDFVLNQAAELRQKSIGFAYYGTFTDPTNNYILFRGSNPYTNKTINDYGELFMAMMRE